MKQKFTNANKNLSSLTQPFIKDKGTLPSQLTPTEELRTSLPLLVTRWDYTILSLGSFPPLLPHTPFITI